MIDKVNRILGKFSSLLPYWSVTQQRVKLREGKGLRWAPRAEGRRYRLDLIEFFHIWIPPCRVAQPIFKSSPNRMEKNLRVAQHIPAKSWKPFSQCTVSLHILIPHSFPLPSNMFVSENTRIRNAYVFKTSKQGCLPAITSFGPEF